jgi:hypothetical protein
MRDWCLVTSPGLRALPIGLIDRRTRKLRPFWAGPAGPAQTGAGDKPGNPSTSTRLHRRAIFSLTIGFNSTTVPSSLPPRGRARDRLGHVGRERRPRRSGPARLSRRRDNGPDRPGGLLPHPSGTTTGAPLRLKKCGMETFRRRVGAPVRRDFILQRHCRRSLTPQPSGARRPRSANPCSLKSAAPLPGLPRPAITASRTIGRRRRLIAKKRRPEGLPGAASRGRKPVKTRVPTQTRQTQLTQYEPASRWSGERPARGRKGRRVTRSWRPPPGSRPRRPTGQAPEKSSCHASWQIVTVHGSIDIRVLSGQTEFFSITVCPAGCPALVPRLVSCPLTGSSGARAKALAPRREMAKPAMAIRVNIDGLQSVRIRLLT